MVARRTNLRLRRLKKGCPQRALALLWILRFSNRSDALYKLIGPLSVVNAPENRCIDPRNNDRHSVKCELHAIHKIFLSFLIDLSSGFCLSVSTTLGQVGLGVVHDISGDDRSATVVHMHAFG